MSTPSLPLVVSLMTIVSACSQARGFVFDVDTSLDATGDRQSMPDSSSGEVPTIPISDSGPTADMTIVYAHSNTTLYAVDPRVSPPGFTTVGAFSFPAGDTHRHTMTDLAVDAAGGIVGVTADALFRVEPTTAACTLLSGLPGSHTFVGLTYVPAGTLDPVAEVLLGGASDGSYWRIDTTTGGATMVGTFQGGWLLSGDLVSIAGAATYVTVRRSTTGTDSLATLDLATGTLSVIGDTGFRALYGLGYWRSTLFGFSNGGEFISIDVRTGSGHLISTPVMQFWGAGVTTLAPIAPG